MKKMVLMRDFTSMLPDEVRNGVPSIPTSLCISGSDGNCCPVLRLFILFDAILYIKNNVLCYVLITEEDSAVGLNLFQI